MRTRLRLLVVGIAGLLLIFAAPSVQALGIWMPSAAMHSRHSYARAILLNDGRVLVIGGATTQATEIYDPAADRWIPTGDIENSSGTPALLPDGSVLLAGGRPPLSPHGIYASAVRFEPATNAWRPAAPMSRSRAGCLPPAASTRSPPARSAPTPPRSTTPPPMHGRPARQ
jgi:hypothetical protein